MSAILSLTALYCPSKNSRAFFGSFVLTSAGVSGGLNLFSFKILFISSLMICFNSNFFIVYPFSIIKMYQFDKGALIVGCD